MLSKIALVVAAIVTFVLFILLVVSFFKKDLVIGHRTLHNEHEAIMFGVMDNQKKLNDLNLKMDILLNIATGAFNRVHSDCINH